MSEKLLVWEESASSTPGQSRPHPPCGPTLPPGLDRHTFLCVLISRLLYKGGRVLINQCGSWDVAAGSRTKLGLVRGTLEYHLPNFDALTVVIESSAHGKWEGRSVEVHQESDQG